jgi:hypothetical protein
MSRRKAQIVAIEMSETGNVVDYLPRHSFMPQFQIAMKNLAVLGVLFEEVHVISR